MRKKIELLFLMMAFCLLVTGCTAGIPVSSDQTRVTLPPISDSYKAPVGDAQQDYTQSVFLYLPNKDGTRLLAQTERIQLSFSHHPADTVIRRLLAYSGNDTVNALSENVELQLASSIEISGDVATVNLSASALQLDHSDLYIVGQAIANTLAQWDDIHYVNLLIAGTQPGLDTAAVMPTGCFRQNLSDDIATIWERATSQKSIVEDSTKRFSSIAALYFPSVQGKGILAEARTLTFPGQTGTQLARTLIEALSAGASYLSSSPNMPDLSGMLASDPILQDLSTGGRKVMLYFSEQLNDALIEYGVPRSVMMASITYTLTTFMPAVTCVEIHIGNETISAIVPSATYENAGQAITFDNGLMRRNDFSFFLLSECTLYFCDETQHLIAVRRPIPSYQTQNTRFLIGQLLMGPQSYDTVQGLSSAFPADLRDADLLGVQMSKDCILLNFSQNFYDSIQEYDESKEKMLVYSIVNTITKLQGIKRVRLYIAGSQPDTLSGHISLPGDFLRNPGIIQ